MLPKENRLPLRFTRDYVEQNGKTYHSAFFVLNVATSMNSAKSPTRFAVIVSKKISKTAVGRNKIKRKLSSQLTKLLPEIQLGFDVIIYIKTPLTISDDQAVNQELSKLLKKIQILQS